MRKRTNRVSSIDATPVAIFGLQGDSLRDESAYHFRATIVGFCDPTNEAASFDVTFAIKRVAGTVSLVAAAPAVVTAVKDDAAWNVTVTIPLPNQVVVSVIGDAANPVKWYGELSQVQVSA